jgi:hypothetical protein
MQWSGKALLRRLTFGQRCKEGEDADTTGEMFEAENLYKALRYKHVLWV